MFPTPPLPSSARSLAAGAAAALGGARSSSAGRRPAGARPVPARRQRSSHFASLAARADDDRDGPLEKTVGAVSDAADAVADLFPASVPHPTAKLIVLVVGGTVALKVVGSVINTVAFVGACGAAGWLLLQANAEGGGGSRGVGGKRGGGRSSSSSAAGNAAADALEEARRLMKKYTK